jgi:hypothetical protein
MTAPNSPIVSSSGNIDRSPFLDGDRGNLFARFGRDWKSQGKDIVNSRYPREQPEDGVEPHRLLHSENAWLELALEKRAVYLQSSLCICHTVEVCHGEFLVGPGSDSRYLLSDTFLGLGTRRDLVKEPCHSVCGCIVPSKQKGTAISRSIDKPAPVSRPSSVIHARCKSNARNLVDHFTVSHLVLRIRRFVRAQKYAHDIFAVTLALALRDQPTSKVAHVIEERSESAVLAQRRVTDIFEQGLRDEVP